MIELVTGLPGSGKTLQTLVRTKARAEKEGRQVFYDGIEGINESVLPWVKWDGQKWFELPPNSIIVIDEAQRLFRPRGRTGEPPEYASKLETHRHLGIDLVFITQNPMLIDSHVRRLCERHWHVMRKFGTKWATIHEFPSGVREDVDKRREGSIRHDFRYPKEAFGWYKSAEVHTHKAHLPMRVWLLLLMPLVFAGAAYAAYLRLNPEAIQARTDKQAGVVRSPGASAPAGQQPAKYAAMPGAPGRGEHLTTADYLAMHQPRVQGLAYTAPIYDEATSPTEAPYPAACVQSAKRCQCYSQQGTRLEVAAELCGQIAEGGFFVAWRQRAEAPGMGADRSATRPQAQLAAPGAEAAAATGFDTKGYGLAARPGEGGGAVAVSSPAEAPPAARGRRPGG